MKTITKHTRDAWLSGEYVDTQNRRPMVRVTIQRMFVHKVDYRVRRSVSRSWAHEGKFATAQFGQASRPRELYNVKSVTWQRGIGQDVGTCKITLFNTRKLLDGESPPNRHDFDLPGWYTPNRGDEPYFRRWNYEQSKWQNWMSPDRIIRTYEGYGYDEDIAPEKDPKMYPSGVWIIDDVTFTTDGLIELNCRDLAKMLLDHVLFPPVVPWDVYPLYWSPFETRRNKDRTEPGVDGSWDTPRYDTDSNMPYVGSGITDGGTPYVDGSGAVRGHHGRDAFDGDASTYWMSVGNRPEWSSAYEYVQGSFASRDVEGVRVVLKGGPYRMYVSVHSDGGWKGRARIPYQPREVDTNADIPYVDAFNVEPGENTVRLPKRYQNADKIRVTFSRLWDSKIGNKYRHRAAVQIVQVAGNVQSVKDDNTHTIGNYGDFTDIVKWMLAWTGFYWPRAGSGLSWLHYSDDSTNRIAPHDDDPVLGKGRVWGDFEGTGTTGEVDLGVEMWDKQPVMDGISQIREMTGFDFWVDESGGAIWRLPNIFSKGNYIMPTEGGPWRNNRSTEIPVIDERTTLIDMSATLSSANVRENVFVGNIAGRFGAVVRGYNPHPSGQRRVGGWTDQHFQSDHDCERMADLIALKQALLYRQNNLTIAANPQIQIDDQVRIYERTTGEGYIHRILAITCNFDNETGKWTYDLTTHWMGDDPSTKKWAFNAELLQERTKTYLRELGKIF